jgi:homoserine kinase
LKEIVLRAPATVANVGPGFDIFAFAVERPFDTVRIRLTDSGRVTVTVVGGDVPLPTDPEKNTAGLAALQFFRAAGLKGGAEIEIRKGMPSCSGLGSSAASAAAAAWGLNLLLGTGFSADKVIGIAALGEAASGGTPHADNVAACALGGFVFVRDHRAVAVDRLDVPRIPLVIQVRPKAQTTTRCLIPASFALDKVKAQMSGCVALVQALMRGDIAGFGRAVNQDEISEPVRSRSIPGYDRMKALALEAGAYGFNVSGGGSSVFAVCPEDRLETVAAALRDQAAAQGETAPVITTHAANGGLRESHDL